MRVGLRTGWIALLPLLACGGTDSPTGTGPNPTTPTELSITSVSPVTPYWGEVVTITGTGFSATAAEVTPET